MPMPPLPARFDGEAEPLPIDLHMHSTASDGALPPAELLALCRARGLTHVALTDHDTLAGVAEAAAAAEREGLTLIPGTELSTRWRGHNIHVVGLLPKGARGALVAGLAAQASAREQAGSERPLGRPDFARALVAAGLVPDLATAFRKHLGDGKAGDVKSHWPELGEAVA